MKRQKIIANIDRAFGRAPRPRAFLRDPKHCADCAARDAMLRELAPRTVRLRDLQGLDHGPLSRVSDDAFQYLMPGLARRVLMQSNGGTLERFLEILEERIDGLEALQLDAVTALLDYLCERVPTSPSHPEQPGPS